MIYIVSDDKLQEMMYSLEAMFKGQEFKFSEPVQRPREPELIPLWEQEILDKEFEMIAGSNLVIFDLTSKDKVGICLMIGMCIATQTNFLVLNSSELSHWTSLSINKRPSLAVKNVITELNLNAEKVELDLTSLQGYIQLGAIAYANPDKRIIAVARKEQLVVRRLVDEYKIIS